MPRCAVSPQVVVDFCREHLKENTKTFANPRLNLIINDARCSPQLPLLHRRSLLLYTDGLAVHPLCTIVHYCTHPVLAVCTGCHMNLVTPFLVYGLPPDWDGKGPSAWGQERDSTATQSSRTCPHFTLPVVVRPRPTQRGAPPGPGLGGGLRCHHW